MLNYGVSSDELCFPIYKEEIVSQFIDLSHPDCVNRSLEIKALLDETIGY